MSEQKYRAWDKKSGTMSDPATLVELIMLGYGAMGADRPIHIIEYTEPGLLTPRHSASRR